MLVGGNEKIARVEIVTRGSTVRVIVARESSLNATLINGDVCDVSMSGGTVVRIGAGHFPVDEVIFREADVSGVEVERPRGGVVVIRYPAEVAVLIRRCPSQPNPGRDRDDGSIQCSLAEGHRGPHEYKFEEESS